MADMAAIASILGSVKTATDIAKLLKDSDLSLEKAETKLKLADLISALADARVETAEIQTLLMEKDKKIRDLEQSLNIKKNLKYEAPYYWLMNEGEKDGPFCQHCQDKDGALIRLQEHDTGYWECKVCGNGYTDASFVEGGGISIGGVTSDW